MNFTQKYIFFDQKIVADKISKILVWVERKFYVNFWLNFLTDINWLKLEYFAKEEYLI